MDSADLSNEFVKTILKNVLCFQYCQFCSSNIDLFYKLIKITLITKKSGFKNSGIDLSF